MALLGKLALLILDEPINGLDAAGMRIMREILVDIAQKHNTTILISSHILGELEKIATHYGIICRGGMVRLFNFCVIKTYSKNKVINYF